MDTQLTTSRNPKVAVLCRGDRSSASQDGTEFGRIESIVLALAAQGIDVQPAIYEDDAVGDIRTQIAALDAVFVWVDPLSDGRNRRTLDPMLRDVAGHGVWVSTHPDVILKMGAKEVLHRTRTLGWGTDTRLYRTLTAFKTAMRTGLRPGEPRVIKQNRGNGGQGVWKVELLPTSAGDPLVRVLHARRGSAVEEMALDAFIARCEPYFVDNGCVIDQPFQSRLAEGMIRCYMVADTVVGYGHQLIKALVPPPPEGPDSPQAQPGPRIMHPASAEPFQALRTLMEAEWIPGLMRLLDISKDELPVLWDADFLYGPKLASGEDSYVLCEINVSCVSPYPDQAPEAVARLVRDRLQAPSAAPA